MPFYNYQLNENKKEQLVEAANKLLAQPNTLDTIAKNIVIDAARNIRSKELPKFEDLDSKVSDGLDAYVGILTRKSNDPNAIAAQEQKVKMKARKNAEVIFAEVSGLDLPKNARSVG